MAYSIDRNFDAFWEKNKSFLEVHGKVDRSFAHIIYTSAIMDLGESLSKQIVQEAQVIRNGISEFDYKFN